MYVGAIVIDCNDFPRMLAFWQAALGYVPREEPEEGWAVLVDPEGRRVNVSIQQVPEPRAGKNRLHLDLYTAEPEHEEQRLLTLGATPHPRGRIPGEDFISLLDPEGNVFDVVDKSSP